MSLVKDYLPKELEKNEPLLDRLEKLLEKIKDPYPDFVKLFMYTIWSADEHHLKELIRIASDPDCTTDDIIHYQLREIDGIDI
ncbi:MAG: hypothetical protein J6I96_05510 [Oscillospiraceae bacterium]|nr:hypothetical protein [Oscillospiraceae bacterium]